MRRKPPKFLSKQEVKRLRESSELRAKKARMSRATIPVRNWIIIDLLLLSGLRAQEAVDLVVGDVSIGHGKREIMVRSGKGQVTRVVRIPEELKVHIKDFLEWKSWIKESLEEDAPLFRSAKGGHLTKVALWYIVKAELKRADVSQDYSIHSLRHTYATHLYEKTKDLRLVQNQLGHASPVTTQIYADVINAEESVNIEIYGDS